MSDQTTEPAKRYGLCERCREEWIIEDEADTRKCKYCGAGAGFIALRTLPVDAWEEED